MKIDLTALLISFYIFEIEVLRKENKNSIQTYFNRHYEKQNKASKQPKEPLEMHKTRLTSQNSLTEF